MFGKLQCETTIRSDHVPVRAKKNACPLGNMQKPERVQIAKKSNMCKKTRGKRTICKNRKKSQKDAKRAFLLHGPVSHKNPCSETNSVSVFGNFWVLLAVFSPRDPENRVRGEILHILVVGELRGMVLKRFYETCAKIVFAKYSLHLQYDLFLFF